MNKDLENLLDECNVIEYKQEVSEGLFKSISAFSNTDGGCIILGVEDETKNIVGIDLSSDKNITGNLFEQIEDVDSVLKLFINMRAEIKGFQREDIWDYPLPALREAVLNAIIHKDYFDFSSAIQIKIFGDSIWIYNSGDLFGGLTLDKLTVSHTSKSRNPLIMKVIYMAGYVEQFGTGIKRMITACLKQGIPAPIFETSQGGFILQMYKQYNGLNERQNKAIKYVVEQGDITNSIYQELNSTTRETSKRDLKRLVDMGIFEIQKDKGNSSIKYNLKCE